VKTTFRLLALFALTVAMLFGVAGDARAQSTGDGAGTAATPRDVPLLLQPSAVKVPALPGDFYQRDNGWMNLAYPPSVDERMEHLVLTATDVKARLALELGQPVLDHVEVRVGRTPEEMAALAGTDLPVPPYATGVAWPALHLVVLSLQSPGSAEAPDLDELVAHELTHVALEDAVLGHHVPRWFTEGLAVHESGEKSWVRTHTLWDATLSRTVLPLADLDRGFPDDNRYEVSIAYAESADFLRFLLRGTDRARFASLVVRVRNGEPFDAALADSYGATLRVLEYEWRKELGERYGYVPVLTGGSVIWVGVVFLMGIGWVRKRKQARAKLAEWEAEERAMETAMAAAKARTLDELGDEQPMGPAIDRKPPVPMVEHEGNWYTLH
jgi:hypothetical protein